MDELSTFAVEILQAIGAHPGCSIEDVAAMVDLPAGADALPGFIIDMIDVGLVVGEPGIQPGQPVPDRWDQLTLTNDGHAAIVRAGCHTTWR